MTRVPLRPLARILEARASGGDPNAIERENKRLRHEEMRDKARLRAEGRLLVLAALFFCAFVTVGVRMGTLSATVPSEPRAQAPGALIAQTRADIVDRQGRLLATNFVTHALYAETENMVDPARAAAELARIFPDLEEEALLRRFTGKTKFLWIKPQISPEQKQAVHDIGDPGLLFGPRDMRLYPNGGLAAHVLGGARFGEQAVQAAELIGVAGIERAFDERLSDPARAGEPLMLTLDLTVQAAVERVLAGGMQVMNAQGAAAILMDAHTGEIVSLASLPDFDPNDRPNPPTKGDPSDSPIFNRAVQGVYELGSTYKIFAAAQALELGLVNPETMIDTRGPIRWGKHRINDFHDYGAQLSVTDVIVRSSNIGTARLAQQIGGARQREFLDQLGLTQPTALELSEAARIKPLLPSNWSELSTMTISYGHGISASPLHLATAYASLLNGGTRVTPTLVRSGPVAPGPRVVSEKTSAIARDMLRQVVASEKGTASFGEVPGYAVGGKTGTADKPKPRGGYYEDKVIGTFASVFPAHDPKYILVVSLDEPVISILGEARRTAGFTAVPVAAEIIRRVAPLLGLRPEIEPKGPIGVTLTSN
ncbi:penicillin-binding protein 2 [Maritimibacter sp. UBA3975]|uniref:peptidoglycan D,D-transpeptidase FtsI family protein n=1 Tax=Maritimibacter sp. UBA3975 TaxID=1946833 RepID=UPI000C0956A4|nr:penicillin-binding protein 2 [Maritimibacter sp. UBA3975]MAM61612.1 cell division protein FtsI [Maritimibacter sp.]|tara:strand:- start:14097 stop:15884 length:1788 start_codon:yes stop_codon:yes gene_type:complete